MLCFIEGYIKQRPSRRVEMPTLPVHMPANGCAVLVQPALDKAIKIPVEKTLLDGFRRCVYSFDVT